MNTYLTSRTLRIALSTTVAGCAMIDSNAYAQVSTSPPAQAQVVDEKDADGEIIVTGTSRARLALDTPLAVTTINSRSISRLTAAGQADILNSVPSIKADGGGGEVAANVFVRGLPSGGQFQFTPLMYDGIPVLSNFGLNSSAFDVYYRNDLSIDRLEFVRGGVSNLFGPGSVAGLINYISRTGDDEFRGTAQLEAAERGRYRGDLAVSGPLGNNLYYAVSGFYRYDEGTIRTNLKTEGFQIRGNLKYALPDDSGSVTVFGQFIDDQVQFFLPIPLDGTTRQRLRGNDGRIVNSVQNNFGPTLGFQTPAGAFTSSINEGVKTKGGQIALAFDKKLGDSFGVNGRIKYSEYNHRFGIWSDGDGIINVPETLNGFLSNRNLGLPANAQFTFAGGGAVPAGSLLFANRFTDRDRPATDFTAEVNLTAGFKTGAMDHKITLGGFYANTKADDINVTTTYLAEFNNTPRLINLATNNPVTGAQTIVARNGLLNAGTGYVNNRHSVERYAGYIADQAEVGRFSMDIGFRIEKFKGTVTRNRTSLFITDSTTPNLSAALRDVVWENGGALTGNVETDEWALALGVLYKVTDSVSLYANASRGYFFPEIRSVGFRPLPVGTAVNARLSPGTQSFTAEIIKQAEAGIKVVQPQFSFTAAGFFTDLANRRQVLFVNDGLGDFIERVNLVGTSSYGVEATFDLKLTRHLHFNGNLTLQRSTYTAFDTNPAIIGNNLERQPELLYNAGLYYDDDTLDVSIFTNYTGDNFTASANTIRLEGWNIVNFDAGYKFGFGDRKNMRIGINVFNVLDTDAVTEGSPRQDNAQATGGAFFVGRPVLPRRITGRLTFNF